MPIATNLDLKKDLKPLHAPPTYPVLVEVPQLRYVVMPLERPFWADGTDRFATCACYQGVGIDAGAPRAPGSACMSSPFRRRHGPRGAGRRKRCKFLATPALLSPDGIAGWTGKIEGSVRDRGRSVGVGAVEMMSLTISRASARPLLGRVVAGAFDDAEAARRGRSRTASLSAAANPFEPRAGSPKAVALAGGDRRPRATGCSGTLLQVSHDHDWARGVLGALLAHRAEKQLPEPAEAARADHQ